MEKKHQDIVIELSQLTFKNYWENLNPMLKEK